MPAPGAFRLDALIPLDAAYGRPSTERPLLVNFWATWCGPCRAEMPQLQRLSSADPRYTVIGVSLDEDPRLAREFLRRTGITFANYRNSAPPPDLRLAALPETWLVDGDGRVLLRMTGTRDWDDERQRRRLREALDGADGVAGGN